jgi:hypothetical protein
MAATTADDRARQIRLFTQMICDALSMAKTLAARSSDNFDGDDALFLFAQARDAIESFTSSDPAMVALRKAGIPPSWVAPAAPLLA